MATTEHGVIKPEKLAGVAAALVNRDLVIPHLFTKKTIEEYRGAKDDTINMVVPGHLSAHSYGWRNDRTNEMAMDRYTERKIALTFGDDVYSGVYLTDEQRDFDLIQWTTLLGMQAQACAERIEWKAAGTLAEEAPAFQIGVLDEPGGITAGVVEARRVMNALGVAQQNRVLLVGSDFEAAMNLDATLTTAYQVGDGAAEAALKEATIGRVKGFTVVATNAIPGDVAYAFVPGAYAFLNAAPSVPESVGFGATASYNGIAVRWIRDYEARRTQDRSIVNTYVGFQAVKDPCGAIDPESGVWQQCSTPLLLRAVRLELGAEHSVYGLNDEAPGVAAALGVATPGRGVAPAA